MVDENNMSQKQTIQETYKTVIQLRTTLVGMENTDDKGLVGEVKELRRDMNGKYNRINKRVWALIIALASAGIVGANTAGLFQ